VSDLTSRQPRFAPENCATCVELLRWRAVTHPDRTAVIFLQDGGAERARLTYEELDAEARRIGAFLQERANPGDTALLLPR
jgi:acyl-CoA synthetase (AMP-forming)/AMP-acid ligase II